LNETTTGSSNFGQILTKSIPTQGFVVDSDFGGEDNPLDEIANTGPIVDHAGVLACG
jgi:hypothetical protein